MKKIYIILGLTLLLMASPMSEEMALALFDNIKKSEYNWVVQQWDAEMKIKTQSRTSTRKSIWERDENPKDVRENTALINTADFQTQTTVEDSPILPPKNLDSPQEENPPQEPQEPIEYVEPKEPITVPAIQ